MSTVSYCVLCGGYSNLRRYKEGVVVCDSCADKHMKMNAWNFNPCVWYRHRNTLKDVLYGVEVEVPLPYYDDYGTPIEFEREDPVLQHQSKRALRCLKQAFDVHRYCVVEAKYAFIKYDRSVSPGFELVCHPFSFENRGIMKVILDALKKEFGEDITDEMIRRRSYSGIHIHVSRHAFTKSALYRTLKLCYDNYELLNHIAGRGANQWAQRSFEPGSLSMVGRITRPYDLFRHDRYQCINLNNAATIEFRMFASTCEYPVFCSYIEFVRALVLWSRVVSSMDAKMESFLSYVEEAQSLFPNLNRRLATMEVM